MKTHIRSIAIFFTMTFFVVSCEQERLESASEVAPGGGTLTEYIAYSIDATDPAGSNVNGRIVFWKGKLNQTLVQISLYNTIPDFQHPALILNGATGTASTTMLDLATVSGDTGELADSKFYQIADTAFYDSIATMDSHISIFLSEGDGTIVATGNLGANAEPVDSN